MTDNENAAQFEEFYCRANDSRNLRWPFSSQIRVGDVISGPPLTINAHLTEEERHHAEKGLRVGERPLVTGNGVGPFAGGVISRPAPEKSATEHMADGITFGKEAERARILAWLNSIKPGEQPYTRGAAEIERKAAMRQWERMYEAITGGKEAPKGEA